MPKGRPVKSEIRQNMIELLFFTKEGYGYGIYKNYIAIFPKVTMRSIYYHLKKGIDLGEFEVDRVEHEKGEFSWGNTAEKTYYRLGKNAQPRGEPRIAALTKSGSG